NGEGTIDGSCNWGAIASFSVWLQHCRQVNSGQQPQRVASSTYFVQSPAQGALVGMVDIRHSLNKAQYPYGHIGYSVVPSQRGRGLATQILAFALARAGELGIQSPLLCCYEHNLASRRVIEKNGLRQVGRYAEKSTGRMVLMYTQS
ncbi:MAG: GNAT family N-acetyltransferase, partial [Oscillospiraceae bacterium]